MTHALTEDLAKFYIKNKFLFEYNLMKPIIFINVGMFWIKMRRLLKNIKKDFDSKKKKTIILLFFFDVQL